MRRCILFVLGLVMAASITVAISRTQAESRAAAQPKDYAVRMVSEQGTFKFSPDLIEIHAGDTISWLNETAAPHTATADDAAAAQAGFDTGSVTGKQFSKKIKLNNVGEFKYHCNFHPMHATVTVTQ